MTALTAPAALANGTCGLSDGSVVGDWRLPNVNELRSLIDYEYLFPALSNAMGTAQWSEGDVFLGVESDFYWSSTNFVLSPPPSRAWVTNLLTGSTGYFEKTETWFIWPVRNGR